MEEVTTPLETTNGIPVLNYDKFLTERLAVEIADINGISLAELIDRIDNPQNPRNYNRRAEQYIKTYLGNIWGGLTDENWLTLKECYMHYAFYCGVELEEVAQDKKECLKDLLDALKESNANKPSEDDGTGAGGSRYYGIDVF